MFKSLFKPKWQHSDPQVRLRALQALDFAQAVQRETIHAMARADSDAQIRRVALKRIVDLDLLWNAAQTDPDAETRAVALALFQQVLCGAEPAGPALAERLQRLAAMTDPKYLEEVARHGVERDLRFAAMRRVERDALLGDIALHDADAELRLWAAQRITQKSTLERVAKQARGKDKKVSGIVREKLEAIAADAARPAQLRQQAKQACAALEALARSNDWMTAAARRDRIEADWGALQHAWDHAKDGAFDADLDARFTAARNACDTAFAQHEQVIAQQRERDAHVAALRQRKQNLCDRVAEFVAELRQRTVVPATDEADAAMRLSEWAQTWREAGTLPTAEEQQMQTRYAELTEQAAATARDLSRWRNAHSALAELATRAQTLVDARDALPPERDIAALEKQLRALPRPEYFALDAAPEQQIAEALTQLRARRQSALAKIKENAEAFTRVVGELHAAVESGQTQVAAELNKTAQELFDALPEPDAAVLRKQGVMQRWQSAAKTVRDLYAWKRWAGAPIKEQLVAEMESLAQQMQSAPGAAHDYSAVAQQIQHARDQWQKLGATDNAGAKALWTRFNAACETAHAPCTEYFAQQRAQRTAHAQQKEAICVGVEQFIASTDWAHADWKKAERLLRGAREEFSRVGPAERALNKKLNTRFRTAMDDLAARLQNERKGNQTRKEGLIQRMSQLADSVNDAQADAPALRDAIAQAKQLQNQWKELGASPESNRLWSDFRAASDRIFARRQALADEQEQQRRTNLESKQALCAQIEASAALTGDALLQARSKVQQVKADFERVGPVPRDAETALAQTFKQVCRAFENRLRENEQQQRAQAELLLEQKARLCEDAECVLEEAMTDAVDPDAAMARTRAAQESWQGLASLSDVLEQPLQQRFQAAIDAIHALPGQPRERAVEQLARQQQANLAVQQQLCLRLEIATGIDSPPEAQQQRMKYQVDLLAKRMRTGEFQSGDADAVALLTQWWMTGAVPAAQREGLRARYQRVRDAVRNKVKGAA